MEDGDITGMARRILKQLRRGVVGRDEALLWMLAAILAGGHILLEDVPGVGKTTLALSLSRVLGMDFRRVQFTPDVLPSDIVGYSLPMGDGLRYQPGAVMTNLLLADELNRGSPRTQSALLEAMEEGQTTVDGQTHPLPRPFTVIATQNPIGAAGTQLLPDSQLDRFLIRLRLGYPDPGDETAMVLQRTGAAPREQLEPVVTRQELIAARQTVAATYLNDAVVRYIVSLAAATRNHPELNRGASPRATLAAASMGRAIARLRGRDYVVPGDIREVFEKTVAHRLILNPGALARGRTAEAILAEIMDAVSIPSLC